LIGGQGGILSMLKNHLDDVSYAKIMPPIFDGWFLTHSGKQSFSDISIFSSCLFMGASFFLTRLSGFLPFHYYIGKAKISKEFRSQQ